jgi:hypothetical protein
MQDWIMEKNLERDWNQNKDLTRLSDPGPAQRPPHLVSPDVPFEHGDGSAPPVDEDHRRDFADAGRSKQLGIPLIRNFPDDLVRCMCHDRNPGRCASVAVG